MSFGLAFDLGLRLEDEPHVTGLLDDVGFRDVTGSGARVRTLGRALSEQRQVVCVGRSTPRPKRRLGREGAPLGQRGGAPLFVNLAGDEMALLTEMVVDLGMN